MAIDVELLGVEASPPRAEARRRRSHLLRRQLVVADLLAGTAAGAVAASLAGLGAALFVGLALLIGAAWPVAAFGCGLYARDDLRTWASGVGEAPKLML